MSLDLIRKHNTWFTKSILILLAITFIVGFGFSFQQFGLLGGVPRGTAAEVNGEKISLIEFIRARENLYEQFGQRGDIPEAMQNYISLAALNQLIDLKLLSQKAREMGFRVSDEDLGVAIRSNPAFQIDGQFIGAEAYKTFIQQSTNDTVSNFETRYREELLAQKLINLISETATVTDDELISLYRKQNEKVNLNFVEFSPQEFPDSAPITKEDISGYYDTHSDEFKTPELRKIRYYKITPDKLESRASVSDEEIQAYYNAYPDEFKSGDGRVLPLSEVDETIRDKIRKQRVEVLKDDFLRELEEKLKKSSFTELAHQNGIVDISESALFAAGEANEDLPLQVASKSFSMNKGGRAYSLVGDTVWIIELSDVLPPKVKGLEESEQEITERIRTTRSRENARLKAEQFLDDLNANKTGINELAKSKGLTVGETGFFSRFDNVPRINSEELKREAFSLEESRPVASKAYASGEEFYVVSLKQIQEADTGEFEAKREELRRNETSRRANEILSGWIQRLRKEAKIIPNESVIRPSGQLS